MSDEPTKYLLVSPFQIFNHLWDDVAFDDSAEWKQIRRESTTCFKVRISLEFAKSILEQFPPGSQSVHVQYINGCNFAVLWRWKEWVESPTARNAITEKMAAELAEEKFRRDAIIAARVAKDAR